MKYMYNLLFLCVGLLVMGQPAVSLVRDINDGPSNSSPRNLFVYDGKVFFGAEDSSGVNTGGVDVGTELWVSDGTSGGTELVIDIRTGSANSNPSFFFEYNNQLFFSANPSSGNELWTTDGTAAGTTNVGSFFIFGSVELGGLIYSNLTTAGSRLHEFNGTTNVPVAGSGTERISGTNFIAFQNKLFLYMEDSSVVPDVGLELYEYDPATDAFTLVRDILSGSGNAGISNFVVANSKLYFEAQNVLWESDGTTAGTVAVAAASAISNVNNFFVYNNNLFFEGDDGTDDQLWVYDTTAATVTKLTNFAFNHDPSDYAVLDGLLYYVGENTDGADTIFRTDGTVAGTEELDIATLVFPDGLDSVDELNVLGTSLIFEAENATNSLGRELYILEPALLSVSNFVPGGDKVEIYPTQVKNELFVKGLEAGAYEVFNTAGQKVAQGDFQESQAIAINLTQGVYFVRLSDGKRMHSQRIIVTK